ncbi:uncharacterized protein N7515_004319 [Penicillium bovifimosum]|uniref:Uncharacterized protein n=1 Tax=Penicillium bovifimosum TaxID=126998 RepID=A0A9W9GZV3_9EURO|nr:uncharacterized protein N7515_004319 [Penicillium bovifimosum]KAJ5135041.1 hypothetical protein N7515_004319 [Penicillium bovifimosum]
MMNWTGGQLQRHHTRSGLLTKAQKQNFAKTRLQKGTAIASPSPFRNFPSIGSLEGSSTQDQDVEEAETNKNQATEQPALNLTGGLPSNRAKELSEVKRQLLKDPDWAAVSATRPLDIAFTPIEEIERFGKRRRLNEKDRSRLAATNNHGSTFFELPKPQRRLRNPSSVIDTIEDIRIEMNGRPVAQSNDSSGMVLNSMSSQSMLLDHEVSSIVDQDVGKEKLTATWIRNLYPR